MTAVLFRVDAGPVVGLGHLQRCLSLASALQRHGMASVFFTNDQAPARARIRRRGFESAVIETDKSWTREDLEETIGLARRWRCWAVVVDSDYEGADYLARLREAGFFVCAIEDTIPHSFPCQLVVNGDAHGRRLRYVSSSGDTTFLLGPEYSILRPEFWSVPQRAVREAPQNVLVTLGGDDPHRLMPGLLRVIDQMPREVSVTIAIGPFFSHAEEVEKIAARLTRSIRLVRAPESVRDLMMEADLAVSAGGQTLYELARVGTPAIAIRTAANQDGQVAVFEELGFIRAAGRAEDPRLFAAIGDALRVLLPDHRMRAAMSSAGQRVVDGQGALRVAATLRRLSASVGDESPVQARVTT